MDLPAHPEKRLHISVYSMSSINHRLSYGGDNDVLFFFKDLPGLADTYILFRQNRAQVDTSMLRVQLNDILKKKMLLPSSASLAAQELSRLDYFRLIRNMQLFYQCTLVANCTNGIQWWKSGMLLVSQSGWS